MTIDDDVLQELLDDTARFDAVLAELSEVDDQLYRLMEHADDQFERIWSAFLAEENGVIAERSRETD